MQRSTFLLLAALIHTAFGATMVLAAGQAAQGFGIGASPETLMMLRSVGLPLIAMGALCFLVRNDPDSATLRSVLILNIAYHGLSLFNDAHSVLEGTVDLGNAMIGVAAHVFIGLGAVWYAVAIHVPEVSTRAAPTSA